MSALFCLFLCFRSYSEKLEEYIPTFYKIRYILEELYVAVMWILSPLKMYINQLNEAYVLIQTFLYKVSKRLCWIIFLFTLMFPYWSYKALVQLVNIDYKPAYNSYNCYI